MNSSELFYFSSFLIFVIAMLAVDLGLVNKKDHVISYKEAFYWSTFWVTLALLFYLFLYFFSHKIHGITNIEELKYYSSLYKQHIKINPSDFQESIRNYRHLFSLEFITGYIIELSLSVDNIFIIILIFNSFKVERRLFHRVLFWGILGAIIFRCLFIFAGAFLINRFAWILYLFAGFLVYTGLKMLFTKDEQEEIDTEKHFIIKFASRFFKVHPRFEGNKFFIKKGGRTFVTPLFLVLLMIEFSDLIFAVDSIPAIFAVTKNPFVVFFSNIFAVLGLRSLFFLLINVLDRFHFFKYGLAVLLTFIGLKMFFAEWLKEMGFTINYSLLVILLILFLSVILSLVFPKKNLK